MDYRYIVKDSDRDFHKTRDAFIIIDDRVDFLPKKSMMSHYEYCKNKGITKEKFNELTRGYYLNGKLIFYKANFIFDEELINESINHVSEIAHILGINEFDIFFGQIPEENFAPSFYYGKYKKGKIIKE